MAPTQPLPATTRLGALSQKAARMRIELEGRLMRLMGLVNRLQLENPPKEAIYKVRNAWAQGDMQEFYLLKEKIKSLLLADKELSQHIAYKGKPPFGKFKSGVTEAIKCLAANEDAAKLFNDILDSIVPARYQDY
jgi:hypothetical protein